MKDYVQSCIELSKKMLKKNISVEAEWTFSLFLTFFTDHRVLLDGYKIGKFWEVAEKIISDFKLREEDRMELGFHPIPILRRDREGKDVFEALEILRRGYEKALMSHRILYYVLSLKVPESGLYRFGSEVQFLVVDTKAQAQKLMITSRENVERERNMILQEPKTEKEKTIYEKLTSPQSPVRRPDPFRSDGFGTLWGEEEDGIKPSVNKVKIY